MNRLPFTKYASKALNEGREIAGYLGFKDVSSIFVLLGLYGADGSLASEVLKMHGVTRELIEEAIKEKSKMPKDRRRTVMDTPKTEYLLEIAGELAMKYGCEAIGSEHILMAMIKDGDNEAFRFLEDHKISSEGIYTDILVTAGIDFRSAKNEYNEAISDGGDMEDGAGEYMLLQYSTDLTEKAMLGKLDPMIGRESEMERLMQILCRRTKNNPCLIGDPGVGKTAIVEGLAQRIAEGNMPRILKNKRILSLDLTKVIAGTKFRGEFEERMKRIVTEATQDDSIILFIDEIHTIIGAGGSEGAMDASNILKPALARGDFQLIGATTSEEYTKYFEKDAALVRRFQPVRVKEPTVEETITILKGIKHRFEDYHRILVSEDVAEAIASLSDRYISDRFLPDKAIDLLDEACARKRMEQLGSHAGFKKERKEIREIIEKIEAALSDGDITEARELKKEKNKLEKSLERKMKRNQKKQNEIPKLTTEDAAEVVSLWTQIPVTQLTKGDMERLRHLEKELHKHVIGQDEAVNAVAKAVKRSRVGLKSPNRPIGSFLFLGPTGVGKTELSKTLAKALFGREEDLIRVDMSEYMEKHSVSKIIGSPPGYVGFGEGGQLSEQIRRHPYSVLLFDEIEKAHPDVFNILLQVLDDGHITDSTGRVVDFKNTVIIMTSNAGAENIVTPKTLGFLSVNDEAHSHEDMKGKVMDEVKRIFKPEFINRIDEIIVFHTLGKEQIGQIVDIMMQTVNKRTLEQMKLSIELDEQAKNYLVEKGYDSKYGARPLRRAIQNEIEDPLAEQILQGKAGQGSRVKVTVKDGKLHFGLKRGLNK